jgi:integrase
MAVKIRRLPSGSYNAMVYVGKDETGKRLFKSVTGSNKRDVAARAAEVAIEARKRKSAKSSDITVGEAIDEYIAKQLPLLSPSTIQGYKKDRRNHYKSIENIKVNDLDEEILSNYMAELKATKTKGNRAGRPLSIKTINNIWHLLTAAIYDCRADFKAPVVPPRAPKVFYRTPDVEGVSAILNAAKGSRIEVAVFLAARCGLRASEIVGMYWGDITDTQIYIHRARVAGYEGVVFKDETKTPESTRLFLLSPDQAAFLRAKREGHADDELVLSMTGNALYKAFSRLLAAHDLPHCRFHDLRHAYASIEHLNGTPDAYIMRQGGWRSPEILHKVYTQAFDSETLRFALKSDELYRAANAKNKIQDEIQDETAKMA